MYKGKFDQKQKGGNVHDIVSQRNQPAAPEIPELKPRKAPAQRPASQSAAPQRPADQKPAAQKAPAQRPVSQAPAKPQKKGPRLGGVIFYTLYFLFILLFFAATFVAMLKLRGWLVSFEASQPTVKSQQVFDQIFTNPDWGAIYDAAGVKDSPFEGKDEFVAYMEEKIGSAPLNFLETSAGLSGDQKYNVRLNDEKIASFTLVNKNKKADNTLENIRELPDWQLGAVDVVFERVGSYRFEKVSDHNVYVNDVLLDDSYTIQKATTKAEEYLPEGVTSAKMFTQEVTGIMALPTVSFTDKDGNPVEYTYDEATRTFTERTTSNSMTEEEKELVLRTAEVYSKYMLEAADRGDLAQYFDTSAPPYKMLIKLGDLHVQGNNGHEFTNQEVDKYERYSDDLFSAHVKMDVNVTRKDGTIAEFACDTTLFFQKNKSGKWKAVQMTNEDVSAPLGQVRLTFMDGDTKLHSDFFMTNAKDIITPLPSVPQGKVFTGWVRKDVNENGIQELTLMFQADATGKAIIPEGMDLEPMTLYALFEDPKDIPAETAPETVAETEGVE